jgi:hypothetical protein
MENIFMKSGRIAYAIGVLLFGLIHFPASDKFAMLVPIPFALYPERLRSENLDIFTYIQN